VRLTGLIIARRRWLLQYASSRWTDLENLAFHASHTGDGLELTNVAFSPILAWETVLYVGVVHRVGRRPPFVPHARTLLE
jgi:hypothetical protein